MSAQYIINLYGPFDLRDRGGRSIRPPGRKECALLAVLAHSPNFRRSRNWLKALLWSDRSEQQASGSLRQAIWRIRKGLAESSALLCADDDYVWLDPEIVTVSGSPEEQSMEFLEGLDIRDEAFEDWLRSERASERPRMALSDRPASAEGEAVPAAIPAANPAAIPAAIPIVVILPPVESHQGGVRPILAAHILDQIVASLAANGLVDVFDLRNFEKDQGHLIDNGARPTDSLVTMRVATDDRDFSLGVQVAEAGTRRVLTGIERTFRNYLGISLGHGECVEFVASAVDTIEAAAFETSRIHEEADTVFKAVHQLMSHSESGQQSARDFLERLRQDRSHAVATAWCAFSYAVGLGERYEVADDHFMEEALTLCHQAVQAGPSNAVVRAIIGHVHAFVFRDFATASEELALARGLSPGLPIVWDFSSMTALYTGHSERAYEFAKTAARLGRFSVLKPYYDTSVMMCAAATGRHEEAIRLGRYVLTRIPKILPVMRHLVGSYAMSGDIASARQMIGEISRCDPEFSYESLKDPTYPIIGRDSIDLMEHAFKATGIYHPHQL